VALAGSASTGSVPTSGFPVGAYTIRANYPGDSNYAPSSASIGSLESTKLTLSVSPNPTAAQTITFTATLTPYSYPGGSTNGEQVGFFQNGSLIGIGTLSNGVATFSTQQIQAATYIFYASYSGDSSFSNSTSSTTSVVVSKIRLFSL
jgi:hypothetical protein